MSTGTANGAGSSGYEPVLLGTIPNMNHTISVQDAGRAALGERSALGERTQSEGLRAKGSGRRAHSEGLIPKRH